MPKYMKEFKFSTKETLMTSPKEIGKLTEQKKKFLLGFGVQENNQIMLSLTSVNGRPVASTHSQSPVHFRDPNDLIYSPPTEAQLKELEKLIQKRTKHPIQEMRDEVRKSEKTAKSKKYKEQTSSCPKQVVRSITFFNT